MKPQYQRRSFTIAAGKSVILTGDARYLFLLGATDATKVMVRIGSSAGGFPSSAQALVKFGKIGPMEAVNLIEVTNTSGAPNTVELIWGMADFMYAAGTITAVNTVDDGSDVTQGAKADAAATSDAGAFSIVALLKRLLGKFAEQGTPWTRAAAAGGDIDNSAVAVEAKAADAALAHQVQDIDLSWDTLTNPTEFVILSDATVLWRHRIVAGAAGRHQESFRVPLQGAAAKAINIQTTAASGAGKVWCNLGGVTK